MKNIIYLDDYINVYDINLKKILKVKAYKKTLENGLIIDREKFINKYRNILKDYKLDKSIISKDIIVITSKLYKIEHKNNIKEILESLNYKKVYFVPEESLLSINKNNLFINCNNTYFYFLFTDYDGKTKSLLYENNTINKDLIVEIIKVINKKNIFVYGKNYREILNIIGTKYDNYYYFENADNYLIEKLINSKGV